MAVMFLSNLDEINKLHKRPPIDASCKVWFHLAKRFQRRRFLKIQPIRIKNKGLRRAQHDTTAACRPQKFEQVYFQMIVDTLRGLTL